MRSVRLWLGVFVAGTAVVAFLTWRWYEHHVSYCRDSPEVAAGGDALSCMEPQHWMAFNVALAFLALVELSLLAAVVVSVLRARGRDRPAQ